MIDKLLKVIYLKVPQEDENWIGIVEEKWKHIEKIYRGEGREIE